LTRLCVCVADWRDGGRQSPVLGAFADAVVNSCCSQPSEQHSSKIATLYCTVIHVTV